MPGGNHPAGARARTRFLNGAPAPDERSEDEILLFLADLGAALSAIGETVDAVEQRLAADRPRLRAPGRTLQRLPDLAAS